MTGNDLMAIAIGAFCVLGLVVIVVSVCVVRYGLHMHFDIKKLEFDYYIADRSASADAMDNTIQKLELLQKENKRLGSVLTTLQADMDETISTKVERHLTSNLAIMDVYKEVLQQNDDDMRSSIAHQLSDVNVCNEDTLEARLTNLSIRTELLLMNAENHYVQVTGSVKELEQYIKDRYIRLCRLMSDYTDGTEVQQRALEVLTIWWGVIRPELVTVAKKKLSHNLHYTSVFTDQVWLERVETAIKTEKNRIVVLSELGSPDKLVAELVVPKRRRNSS